MDWTGFVKYRFLKHEFVRKCIRKSKQSQTIYLLHSYASIVPFYRPLKSYVSLVFATSPFYSPSLRLSLSRPKYLFHAVRELIQFTVYHAVISFQGKQG